MTDFENAADFDRRGTDDFLMITVVETDIPEFDFDLEDNDFFDDFHERDSVSVIDGDDCDGVYGDNEDEIAQELIAQPITPIYTFFSPLQPDSIYNNLDSIDETALEWFAQLIEQTDETFPVLADNPSYHSQLVSILATLRAYERVESGIET